MATSDLDASDRTRVDLNPAGFILDMALDLKLVIGFVILTLAFIYVPYINETIVRSALGLVMVLFVPGYALIAALFPGKKDIDGIERAALSFGLSIAVSPLIGLGLNYTPWGIRLDPIVICLTIFTLLCVFIANKRRHNLPAGDRFGVDFRGVFREVRAETFSGSTPIDKVLTLILLASIILSIATLAYVVLVPKQGETFTEFYILGPGGKADNYPTKFTLGDQKPIIVGIVNHEYRDVSYDLVVRLNDSASGSVTGLHSERLVVADNQTLEKTLQLKPDHVGSNMKLEFLLYADGNMTAPYRELHLWINVTPTVT